MNIPRFASAAAKLLRASLPDEEPVLGDRARGIATIERAMHARARKRRLRWSAAVFASAAAVFALVWTGRQLRLPGKEADLVSIDVSPAGRGAALRAGDHSLALPERHELGSGQQIETPSDGGASLSLSTGTAMTLAGNTSFRVDSQGRTEHFSLQRGELTAHVAKLGADERFIIATPDAEVEVRGTRFRLRVVNPEGECGAGSRTRLEVSEGIVEVRALGATVNVTAGQHWPSDCSEPDSGSPRDLAGTTPATDASVGHPTMAGARPPTASAERPSSARTAAEHASDLAQQNDLFAQAVALRRQGDAAGALRAYQALLSRFPSSPLAEDALVGRMRVLSSSGDPRARAEAGLYLARYPKGFALKEAQRLAGAP